MQPGIPLHGGQDRINAAHSGISGSISVISGWCLLKSSRASRPSDAFPIRNMSSSKFITAAIPSLNNGWSSTVRILIFLVLSISSGSLPHEGIQPDPAERVPVCGICNRRVDTKVYFCTDTHSSPYIQLCANLCRPWYWDIFQDELETYHHMMYASA